MEMNLVDLWLKKDPIRWKAGALSGVFAVIVMAAFSGVLALLGGREFLFPIKVAALPFLGNSATDFNAGLKVLITGGAFLGILGAVLGAFYAHFTGSNRTSTLLSMGLVWGAFSWIFITNLFLQSFPDFSALLLSPGVLFWVCMVFGLALASVSFFDRALRR